jgi:hypothetical protein
LSVFLLWWFFVFFWVFLFLFHLVITCSFWTREGAGFGWVSALGFWSLGRHHPRPGKLGAKISQTPPTPCANGRCPTIGTEWGSVWEAEGTWEKHSIIGYLHNQQGCLISPY